LGLGAVNILVIVILFLVVLFKVGLVLIVVMAAHLLVMVGARAGLAIHLLAAGLVVVVLAVTQVLVVEADIHVVALQEMVQPVRGALVVVALNQVDQLVEVQEAEEELGYLGKGQMVLEALHKELEGAEAVLALKAVMAQDIAIAVVLVGVAALAGHTVEAVEASLLMQVLSTALVLAVQFVSFGPAVLVHSHLLVQGINNEPLY
jgi:hypothetical protein